MLEQARAELILFFGIDEPTDKQIAEYILFGVIPSKHCVSLFVKK